MGILSDGWDEAKEVTADRDAIRAEVERLREELAAAKESEAKSTAYMVDCINTLGARDEAAEARAERLRAALVAQRSLPIARSQTPSSRKHEDEVEEFVEAVLSETPAQSLAKLKAAAPREAADKIKQDNGVIGQCSAYMALTLMADELEAE